MKISLSFSLISMMAIAAFPGCKKTDRVTSTQFLSDTVSGIGTSNYTGSLLVAGGSTTAKIEIEGYYATASGAELVLWIEHPITAAGANALDNISAGATYDAHGIGTPLSSAHGTITITAISPDLIGNFSLTLTDSTHITGSFDVVPST